MPTFVFSRRAIQSQLDHLDGVLSPKQLDDLIGRLNRVNDQRLAAMWEAVFLGALAQETQFRHEEELVGRARPDFQFTLPFGSTELKIAGDITSVTDSGLNQENPVSRLHEEVYRLAQKHGLDPNHFNISVNSSRLGKWPNQRVKLDLPKGKSLADILSNKVDPFIKALAKSDQAPHTLDYQMGGVHFTIYYVHGQWSSSGSHAAYDVILSLTENHVYRRLKQKADQLGQASSDAVRLVVLCDCDCAAMNPNRVGSGYKASAITEEFLRRTTSVDLGLLVTVKKRNAHGTSSREVVLDFTLVAPPKHAWSSRLTEERYQAVSAFLAQVVGRMPEPIQDTRNSWLRAREEEFGTGKHGGYTMSEKKLKLSARAVHELLAGTRTLDDFLRLHLWHNGGSAIETSDGVIMGPNPFAEQLRAGRLITTVTVSDDGDSDDNSMEFTFGLPDAAVSRFRRRSM